MVRRSPPRSATITGVSLSGLAESAGAGIDGLLRRGRALAAVVATVALAAGVFCLVTVAVATSGAVRAEALTVVAAGGAVAVGAALLAWLVLDRARRRTGLVTDLRRLVDDPAARGAVDAMIGMGRARWRPLTVGGLVWALRRTVAGRRAELADLWISLLALTRLPLLVGVALVGTVVLVVVGLLAGLVALLG